MTSPQLLWDIGTAYDLFVSLDVLHNPANFGLRGAWAAGVRARLPIAERETLDEAQLLCRVPLHWVHNLPEPKDSAAALWALGRIPPADRLPTLAMSPKMPPGMREMLQGVAARRAWDEGDVEVLRAHPGVMGKKHAPTSETLTRFLTGWSRAEEFGERYLVALRTYHEVFFAEEERRLRPVLEAALAQAQELAERLALPDLLEELSQGLRFAELPEAELVLAPSYWSTPIVFLGEASPKRAIWLFGAKPADASLVPGAVVPDTLLRTFKALSASTRLRILQHLAEEPLTPAQLSRRLRLRIPTVTHHLRILRLAGLVHLTVAKSVESEKEPYTIRFEAIDAAFAMLKRYLDKQESP
jgi:DNA-binding transcriptional ArsR family regulator